MTTITPYVRGQYPTIEGNERVYFDAEFTKIEKTLRQMAAAFKISSDLGSYTIASGVATITQASPGAIAWVVIDTEGAGATDDLNTITWSAGVNGQIVVVYAANSSRTVVLKDAADNLVLAGDMTLDNNQDTITLHYFNDVWYELARSNNGA